MPTKKTIAPVKKVSSAKVVAKTVSVQPKKVKQVATKKVTVPAVALCVAPCACATCCPPEQAFWINNGPVVDSVEHLRQAMRDMSEEQYRYHTKREGNDFARWVRDCLHDTECATRLEKANTKSAAVKALTSSCCC